MSQVPGLCAVWARDDRGLPVLLWAGPEGADNPEALRHVAAQMNGAWREDVAGSRRCLVMDLPQ